MAVVLQLGDFTFADNEVPERITMETKIGVVVRKFVGGARSVNMMGYDPAPIEWSGMLLGSNALQRARALKQMALAQKMITLSFSEYNYAVVISDFTETFQREYEIYYRITVDIVADSAAQGPNPVAGVDTLVGADITTATGLASSIGNSTLSSAIGAIKTATAAISSIATAAKSTLQSVLAPLAAAQAQVKTLIAAGENTLQSVSTVGGLLPNNPIAQQVSRLSGQLNTMVNQPQLITLNGVLSRIGTNIGQVGTATQSVPVMTGNLFDQAAKLYGNAENWTALSTANPQLQGDTNIVATPAAPVQLAVPPRTTYTPQEDEAAYQYAVHADVGNYNHNAGIDFSGNSE